MMEHLIACTITALLAGALAFVLRRRSAELRFSLLLSAMLAFAVPTPLITKAAAKLMACLVQKSPSAQSFQGFPVLPATLPWGRFVLAAQPHWHISTDLLWLLSAIVSSISLARWLRRVLRPVERVREANSTEFAALESAKASMNLTCQVDLCIAAPDRSPGARGLRRPSVVLPDTLSDVLSQPELHAILTHELAHIARRDNLSAAIVRVIVSTFWFHPLLWWMERRMLAEREAACDERVLAQGADPADYVSAIAKVCRMSFTSSNAGYAGATGANLKQRMEFIMSAQAIRPSSQFLRAIPGVILALGVAGSYVRAQAPALPATHPANNALFQRAKDCLDQGRFQEAENLFRQLYTQDPGDSRGLTGLTETYMSEQRPNDALELMQSEIGKQPGRRDLQIAMSNLYVRTEQYDRAIAELQPLVDSASTSKERSELRFRLGETYRRKGDLDAAMREFAAASADDPADINSLTQLALLFDGTGKHTEAIALYDRILQLQPDHTIALNNLAYLKSETGKDLDQSLAMALQAHAKTPKSADVDDTVAWIYIKMNRPGDAEAYLNDALQLEPDNASFHYHLGLALFQSGDRAGSRQELKTALAGNLNAADRAGVQNFVEKITH